MFVNKTKKIFPYIDIREFPKRRGKPDNISTSIFIDIFVYFIISSIVSPIFITIVSHIIAPVFVISIGL